MSSHALNISVSLEEKKHIRYQVHQEGNGLDTAVKELSIPVSILRGAVHSVRENG
jgi:hypothetical protein